MKLFLTSSCLTPDLHQAFLQHYKKDSATSTCYFIPTATDPDENKFYTCKSMDDLTELGFKPIWYSLKFKNKEQIARELADSDMIWVGGGNTFYLLDVAKKVGFLDVVKDLVVNKQVAYGGVSAGTILAQKDISCAGWEPGHDEDTVAISDLTAFDFVDFTNVVHYESDQDEIIKRYKKEDKDIYTIPNGGMIVVDGEELSLYGGVQKYE